MSQSTIVTGPEAVELARQMREAGVQRFVLTSERFSAVLSPPPPKAVVDIQEQIAELKPEQRRQLLDGARREYDDDLFGAVR